MNIREDLAMPKYIRNSGKPWTPKELQQLDTFADKNTPTRVIGLKLGRTEAAIRKKNPGVGLRRRRKARARPRFVNFVPFVVPNRLWNH